MTDADKQQEARCPHEHQRVKRRRDNSWTSANVAVIEIEWVRCVLNDGHEGEHECDELRRA